MSKYREQRDRVQRWFEKFRLLDSGRPHNQPSDNYVDEVYAFFMNCYHLKDWIKNDPSAAAKVSKDVVEAYINETTALRLCADVCNSLKHLENSGRSGVNPEFGRKQYGLAIGGAANPTISLKYEVKTDSGPIDAFQLASDCLTAWDSFFSTHGL